LRADGVQNRPDVIHSLFEAGESVGWDALREPGASLVEQD
jgi:hypothetical protein